MGKGDDKQPRWTWDRPCLIGKKVITSVSKTLNVSKKILFAAGVQNLKACVITGVGGGDQTYRTHLELALQKRPFKVTEYS